MFSAFFFLSNHYDLEQFLHPSLLLNFRPSSSAASRDRRLPPAQARSLSHSQWQSLLFQRWFHSRDKTGGWKKRTHSEKLPETPFSNTFPDLTALTTSLTVKQSHLEDIWVSKPFRSPLQYLCLAKFSHRTLAYEGLHWCTGSLTDIKHMLLSAKSFSLGLFIRKDVSVRQPLLSWPGCSAEGRHWFCAISRTGCSFELSLMVCKHYLVLHTSRKLWARLWAGINGYSITKVV